MDSNFDLNLSYIANENEFLFDLNQTPTNEEVDALNNEDDDDDDDDDDDALVNSHVYASDLLTEIDQGMSLCWFVLKIMYSHVYVQLQVYKSTKVAGFVCFCNIDVFSKIDYVCFFK